MTEVEDTIAAQQAAQAALTTGATVTVHIPHGRVPDDVARVQFGPFVTVSVPARRDPDVTDEVDEQVANYLTDSGILPSAPTYDAFPVLEEGVGDDSYDLSGIVDPSYTGSVTLTDEHSNSVTEDLTVNDVTGLFTVTLDLTTLTVGDEVSVVTTVEDADGGSREFIEAETIEYTT